MPGRRRVASGERIEGRAANWLARLDGANPSATIQADFELWCRSDPLHFEAYLRLLRVWNRLDTLQTAGRLPTRP
jgi:ferric-dicitrate binding protein FerR (iron transport regulator)